VAQIFRPFLKINAMANIGKYVEEANLFFKEVAAELQTPDDIGHASRVTTAVFHTLRDRITVEESMHLISNLPMILKGIYVDGWKITRQADRTDTLDEFLDEVREHAPREAGRDFGGHQMARDTVKGVLRVLRKYVDEGEIRHIQQQLPEGVAALFE
jgi:uncharacterized protein (DUF2267 family)